MRPTAAAISVSTQFENVGDAWILRELIRLAATRVPLWVDVTRCPPAFVANLGLDSLPSVTTVPGLGRLVSRVLRHRRRGGRTAWFLGPGGYHGERSGSDLAKAWVATGVLASLRMAGAHICQVGASYERLGPGHRGLLVARGRLLHSHLVRDEASAVYARSLGIRVHGVAADLAFADPTWSSAVSPDAATVALVFRSDQHATQPAEVTDFSFRLARAAPWVRRWRAIAQVERDRATASAVADAVSATGSEAEVALVDHALAAARDAYRGCSHVIGNRLHGLLLGASAGAAPVPVVDTERQAKIVGAFAVLPDGPKVIASDSPDAVERAVAALRDDHPHPLDPKPAREALEAAFDRLLGAPTNGVLDA